MTTHTDPLRHYTVMNMHALIELMDLGYLISTVIEAQQKIEDGHVTFDSASNEKRKNIQFQTVALALLMAVVDIDTSKSQTTDRQAKLAELKEKIQHLEVFV